MNVRLKQSRVCQHLMGSWLARLAMEYPSAERSMRDARHPKSGKRAVAPGESGDIGLWGVLIVVQILEQTHTAR